jgi:hypothetical protein
MGSYRVEPLLWVLFELKRADMYSNQDMMPLLLDYKVDIAILLST